MINFPLSKPPGGSGMILFYQVVFLRNLGPACPTTYIIHSSAGTSYSLPGVSFNSQRSQAAGMWALWGLGRHIPRASLDMPFLTMWAVIFIRTESPSFHPMWGGLSSSTVEFCCSKPGVEWGSCPSAGPKVVTAAAWAQQANGPLPQSPGPSGCQGLGSPLSHS